MTPSVPARAWLSTYLRLFAIQGSWNYETLLGNGVAFALDPVLRALPGGRDGPQYREALAREARYFNAHPYLASVAVGALARAELERSDPATIERFRVALASPLGSLGDQLVWSSWLPFCSLLALTAFGLGAPALVVVVVFLATYNVGHLALRAWGLAVGFRRGLAVAGDLNTALVRRSPLQIARVATLLAGLAIPLTLYRVVGAQPSLVLYTAGAAFVGALVMGTVGYRAQGWRVALVLVAALVLFGVTR